MIVEKVTPAERAAAHRADLETWARSTLYQPGEPEDLAEDVQALLGLLAADKITGPRRDTLAYLLTGAAFRSSYLARLLADWQVLSFYRDEAGELVSGLAESLAAAVLEHPDDGEAAADSFVATNGRGAAEAAKAILRGWADGQPMPERLGLDGIAPDVLQAAADALPLPPDAQAVQDDGTGPE